MSNAINSPEMVKTPDQQVREYFTDAMASLEDGLQRDVALVVKLARFTRVGLPLSKVLDDQSLYNPDSNAYFPADATARFESARQTLFGIVNHENGLINNNLSSEQLFDICVSNDWVSAHIDHE
ncbi:MAG: hypothetical protein Q7K35_02835 [bacterium]|nr:hypothetical protein [bacterium]